MILINLSSVCLRMMSGVDRKYIIYITYRIKTHDSESRGQEEAATTE